MTYDAKLAIALSLSLPTVSACAPTGEGEQTNSGVTSFSTTTFPPTTGETTDSDSSNGDGDGDGATTNTGDGDGEPGTASESDGDGDGDSDSGPKFDLGESPDAMVMECIDCALTIASMQSGTFEVLSDNIFATATLMNQIVYALGNYGNGRFIASADSSLPFNEVTDCPLHAWLAGTESEPSIFYFGWTDSDGPINFNIQATSAGVHLPPEYIGDPAALAADFDIVMYLESSGQFGNDEPSDAEMNTLLDYVSMHGGGLYVVSEFSNGSAYLNVDDLESVNRVMVPLGVEAQQVSLNWGNVDGNIEFECFPAPVG